MLTIDILLGRVLPLLLDTIGRLKAKHDAGKGKTDLQVFDAHIGNLDRATQAHVRNLLKSGLVVDKEFDADIVKNNLNELKDIFAGN